MNLLNNWLIQVFIGNIAWIIFCKTIKWIQKKLNSSSISSSINGKKYLKQFINKQFKISFFISSVLTITLIIMFANKLQNQIPELFILFGIIIFLCFLCMLGAFEESFEHWND